jgi:hypothetical protein
VPLKPSAELPARDRPIAGEDFAGMRRDQEVSDLLKQADEVITRTPLTGLRTVFVHGGRLA